MHPIYERHRVSQLITGFVNSTEDAFKPKKFGYSTVLEEIVSPQDRDVEEGPGSTLGMTLDRDYSERDHRLSIYISVASWMPNITMPPYGSEAHRQRVMDYWQRLYRHLIELLKGSCRCMFFLNQEYGRLLVFGTERWCTATVTYVPGRYTDNFHVMFVRGKWFHWERDMKPFVSCCNCSVRVFRTEPPEVDVLAAKKRAFARTKALPADLVERILSFIPRETVDAEELISMAKRFSRHASTSHNKCADDFEVDRDMDAERRKILRISMKQRMSNWIRSFFWMKW